MIQKKTITHVSFGIGLTLVMLFVLVAILGPVVIQTNPHDIHLELQNQPPSSQYWFGLDQNGSDVFTKIIYGSRQSLIVVFSVVFISALVGLIIGGISGFKGGWMDDVVMRIIDMVYAFPNFLLALALVAFLGPSLKNIILALCASSWASYARLVRGEVLHLKHKEFVINAKAYGAKPWRLMVLHIYPSLINPLVSYMICSVAGVIIAESALNFLGLGSSEFSWGYLLNVGRGLLTEAPHISLFAGLAIFLLVFAFNLLGDATQDYLDPKS